MQRYGFSSAFSGNGSLELLLPLIFQQLHLVVIPSITVVCPNLRPCRGSDGFDIGVGNPHVKRADCLLQTGACAVDVERLDLTPALILQAWDHGAIRFVFDVGDQVVAFAGSGLTAVLVRDGDGFVRLFPNERTSVDARR